MSKVPKSAKPPPVSAKRVFIVEDHPVFRQGLVQMLRNEDGLSVCGEAGDVATALTGIPRLNPDLILVNITLPGESGLSLIKKLRGMAPHIKMLVVSMHDEALYANRVLRAGAAGYILKQEDPEEIVRAIRDVLEGRTYVSEAVLDSKAQASARRGAARQMRPLAQLTDEELQLLELIGRGRVHGEIARALRSNTKSVSARCAEIKKKLGLHGANELVRYAVCWVETGTT